MSSLPPSYFPASLLLYSQISDVTNGSCSKGYGVQERAENISHTLTQPKKLSTSVCSARSNFIFLDLDVWMERLEK